MDALMGYDWDNKPFEFKWPQADVIIGNPPFLGGNKIRAELGDKYVDDLFDLYKGRVPAFADLVCYWFEKARAMIEKNRTKRVGLLATQAIRGGVNRKVLEKIKETGDIFWAQSDRDWILNGATVHVSMIGFDKAIEKDKTLDSLSVADINPDLTSHSNLTTAFPLFENLKICFIGTKKAGGLILMKIWQNNSLLVLTHMANQILMLYLNGLMGSRLLANYHKDGLYILPKCQSKKLHYMKHPLSM